MRYFTRSQTWLWGLNSSRSQIQSRSGPNFSKLRIPASRSVGTEMNDQKNTSHVLSKSQVTVLKADSHWTSHVGSGLRVTGILFTLRWLK